MFRAWSHLAADDNAAIRDWRIHGHGASSLQCTSTHRATPRDKGSRRRLRRVTMMLAQNSSASWRNSLPSSIRQQLQERINHAVPNIHSQENQRRSDRVASISQEHYRKAGIPYSPFGGMPVLEAHEIVNDLNRNQAEHQFVYYLRRSRMAKFAGKRAFDEGWLCAAEEGSCQDLHPKIHGSRQFLRFQTLSALCMSYRSSKDARSGMCHFFGCFSAADRRGAASCSTALLET